MTQAEIAYDCTFFIIFMNIWTDELQKEFDLM